MLKGLKDKVSNNSDNGGNQKKIKTILLRKLRNFELLIRIL